MTTLQQLVDDCRDTYLYQEQQPEVNQLAGAMLSTDTSFTVLSGVSNLGIIGTRVCIDFEEMRVWAFSGTAASSVERGVGSSTAASHSQGTLIEVAPKFSQYRVQRAINEELNSLSGEGIFQVNELEVTYNPAIQGYDLGNISWEDIIDVRYEIPGPSKNWPVIRNYAKLRNADTIQFPSGNGIIVYEPGWAGLPVRIRYRSALGQLVNPTDDATTIGGLPTTATDIPVIGAAIRLSAGGEVSRNLFRAQRDPMLMESIPPQAVLNSPKNLMMLRVQRVAVEAARLARLYPKVGPR